ncbi:hypothetical protein B0A48_01158 [Cryoendolithus antarcticus]|uniref:PEBP-like protein n=1 Tax=Cryoendolithus antarcticus TaxID=1507870 RepID=A0A1V8TSW0_9PEZI|nr:hypothetical protein B0A48_01158 [Cryoendolithus antarcticus]
MKSTTTTIAATAALLLSPLATAQTPAGFQPYTSTPLSVSYNGNLTVSSGALIAQPLVQTLPVISSTQTFTGTHMLVFIDLSLPASARYANSTAVLAPGIGDCRTTRLHWLQTGLVQNSAGVFENNTPATAEYGGPGPPLNDTPHDYAFYLFAQPANFTLPAFNAGRDVFNRSAAARVNYSITAFADVAGAPVAGNYFMTQNAMNNATGDFVNGPACPASLAGTTGAGVSQNGTGAGNGTSGGATPPVPYTGAGGKVGVFSGALLAVVGGMAFALL